MVAEAKYFEYINGRTDFNRDEILHSFRNGGFELSDASFYKRLAAMVKRGELIRVGKDRYCFPKENMREYKHVYSELANEIGTMIKEQYPILDFSILELIQFNDFVNHQIAHNVVFLFVEEDIMGFVFESLKEKFPGKVLFKPTAEIYHLYWSDNMIVIGKLITESPRGQIVSWHTRLEKFLVDIVSEPLLLEAINESEYPNIYEEAFSQYVVDESCLFRYARRRKTDKKIRKLIKDKTNITLRTEG